MNPHPAVNCLSPRSNTILTDIVKRALIFSVTDLGQLTTMQRRELDRAVSAGVLIKGRGGPYPALKTVWAHPGYDFAAERRAEIDYVAYLSTICKRAA